MEFTVYLICLGVGLLFTLITVLTGHHGGGHDGHVGGAGGHAEAGADGSDSAGFSAVSPTVIAAFVTAFGGFGAIFHQLPATRPPYLSAPLAAACAFVVASAMVFILRQLFAHTQSSSESKVATLIGQTATVIGTIPAQGVGEIAYVQGGTRYTAPARVENGSAMANGKLVKITRIVASQFYVEPI
jgi:membrane protein implicated in regulation of membrane protease activity